MVEVVTGITVGVSSAVAVVDPSSRDWLATGVAVGSCTGVVFRDPVVVAVVGWGNAVGAGTEGTTVDAMPADGEAWRRHSCRYSKIFCCT